MKDKSKSWALHLAYLLGDMPKEQAVEIEKYVESIDQSARAEEYTKGYKDGLKKVTPKQGDMTDVCRSLFDEMKAKAKAEGAVEALERAQKELVKRFMKKPADAYDRLTKLLKEYKKPLSPKEEGE